MNGSRPACSAVEAFLVEIVDVDPQPGFRQRQHQRNADMAGAADNGHVGIFDGRWRVRQRLIFGRTVM